MYMAAIAALLFAEPPGGARDAMLVLIGGISSAFGSVIAYFFGSSTGSAEKTALMNARGGLMSPERKTP
jgi:hypothetical protein